MPNPKKKTPLEIKSLARAYTEKGIEILGGYLNSPAVKPEIKVEAIKIMFDRGWGRPVSKTEHTGEDGGDIRITIRNIIEESKKK